MRSASSSLREQLDGLAGLLGGQRRMAMATGRPFVAVEHTLRHLLGYFDLDASVFIGTGTSTWGGRPSSRNTGSLAGPA